MTTTNALESRHRHDSRCWWDHLQAGWVCPPVTRTPERPPVDVRDMLVVHTALLREFRLAPAAVGRVALGDRRRAAAVGKHLRLLCDLLHHHHQGEDELLWPPLRDRVPHAALARLEAAEAQHVEIDAALDRVAAARRTWTATVDAAGRDALVTTLSDLHGLLAEHLDLEERTLLPLAAVHLTEAEWAAVGEAGAAAVPKPVLPLVFGMFAYEGDPEVLATMLAAAPALPRAIVPRIAPRIYARRAVRIHGTARP
ncbi:hemerythrin domain-containing protein [Actinomycetospora chiangmaiensis]|uniref:hemerythrin domain-containing protein n=1 Tax=Actinomycetospora chiangmaiensis TaxID=402650 RepID=UPI00037817A1|nr:hemerythrin domain-containing protein [Actinomycetospora chiangmaiensis]